MRDYSNTRMREVISEYVHDKRYRRVLELIFCDGLTYEQAAEEVRFSVQNIKRIVKLYREYLFNKL